MRIRVPVMIQDPTLSGHAGLARIVEWPYVEEDTFRDGPACTRLAIHNRDPITGKRQPAVPFVPPSGGRKMGRYRIADKNDVYATDFLAVSVFGMVLRTMHMFEEEDTLGRPLAWAFDGPQLLVVPCAGNEANAFYARDSRSLEFFHFEDPRDPARRVFTSLSRDIVCHETGHAILDGIAPRLWDAITPQALALHEAVADLVAVVMSFRSQNLCEAILAETKGSIADVGAFSSIGEEFGQAADNLDCLRDLRNALRMDQVDHSEPHDLSQVLSAALYKMLIGMHERWWRKLAGDGAPRDFSVSGKALAIAASQFKRMIFRALDYLPPAEASFADYARAIIAADQASHPEDEDERRFIREEFVQRGIVSAPEALEVETDFEHAAVKKLDLDALVRSDEAAEAFVTRNRDLLHIPGGIPLHVEPRLDVTKLYYHRAGQKRRVRECLLKVWWMQPERNALGRSWPEEREISVGTTLAIDWTTRRVRAVLTSDRRSRPEEAEAQRAGRDAILRRLVARNVLRPVTPTPGEDATRHGGDIQADVSTGVLRVRSMARMLDVVS